MTRILSTDLGYLIHKRMTSMLLQERMTRKRSLMGCSGSQILFWSNQIQNYIYKVGIPRDTRNTLALAM
jgi:hypothetical protein